MIKKVLGSGVLMCQPTDSELNEHIMNMTTSFCIAKCSTTQKHKYGKAAECPSIQSDSQLVDDGKEQGAGGWRPLCGGTPESGGTYSNCCSLAVMLHTLTAGYMEKGAKTVKFSCPSCHTSRGKTRPPLLSLVVVVLL